MPDAPEQVLASLGNYIFTGSALLGAVTCAAADEASKHGLAGSIVPMLVEHGAAAWYDFATNDTTNHKRHTGFVVNLVA